MTDQNKAGKASEKGAAKAKAQPQDGKQDPGSMHVYSEEGSRTLTPSASESGAKGNAWDRVYGPGDHPPVPETGDVAVPEKGYIGRQVGDEDYDESAEKNIDRTRSRETEAAESAGDRRATENPHAAARRERGAQPHQAGEVPQHNGPSAHS